MTIQLTPEDEKLIRKGLRSGTFRSIEEVIHDALAAQDSEAEWLSDQRESIDEKIGRGIAQLDRGQDICRGGRARTACSSACKFSRRRPGWALYFHTVLDQVQQGFDHLWSDGSRMML